MKDDRLYLIDILDCLERIEAYTQAGRDAFMRSTMIQDAVIRNFEIIGEAAKQVSKETRSNYREVPWRRIGGFRDILIHAYSRVRMDEIWGVIEHNLATFKRQIRSILDEQQTE